MKSLAVVRHAKSSWGDLSLDDHDRPLNGRGRRVAPQMGELVAARLGKPDVILSSTALRARTTAGLFAEQLAYPDAEIVEEGQIYLASLSRLLQVLRQIDESHGSAMIFGHVPGVQDLSNALCRDADIGHFPTCAVSVIELEIDYWGEIDVETGRLRDFLVPKELFGDA